MTEVISVKFNNKSKAYYFDPVGISVEQGAKVIVETAKGNEFGECAIGNHNVDDTSVVLPLRPLVRIATESDLKVSAQNKVKESDAFEYCQRKILEFGLDMKLVDVEYGFEGGKILFFFTSEGRVDFRELVRDLASVFKSRIELRQIGVRDEAKMLGGLGICGKPFCCTQFLSEFHSVSIKMAKTQGLSLNPTKISGTCGRLMCCLKYEEVAYEDLVKRAPKIYSFVETPNGKGSVVNVNLLRGNAKVRLEDGIDTTLKTFAFDELDVLGGKARRAEYIAAKAEGKLEEAGFKPSPPPKPPERKPMLDEFAPRPSQPAAVRGQNKDSRGGPNRNPRNRSNNVPGNNTPPKSASPQEVKTAAEKSDTPSATPNKPRPRRRNNNRNRKKPEGAVGQQEPKS